MTKKTPATIVQFLSMSSKDYHEKLVGTINPFKSSDTPLTGYSIVQIVGFLRSGVGAIAKHVVSFSQLPAAKRAPALDGTLRSHRPHQQH